MIMIIKAALKVVLIEQLSSCKLVRKDSHSRSELCVFERRIL
jgi:hypothetical protein